MNVHGIKAFAVDVDGTLTDGTFTVSDRGSVSKSFHTYDMIALCRLCRDGIPVLIITGSDDGVIRHKLRSLKKVLTHSIDLIEGSRDKLEDVREWLEARDLEFENLFFIGDADNDMKVMLASGAAGCPHDALPEVQELSDEVSQISGGRGAVYDIIRTFYLVTDRVWL